MPILIAILLLFTNTNLGYSQDDKPVHVSSPAFIAISVSNIALEKKWFEQVFGAHSVDEVELSHNRGSVSLMRAGDLAIEIIYLAKSKNPYEAADKPKATVQGHVKNGVFVKDAQETYDILKKKNIKMRGRLFIDENFGMKSFLIEDPEHNVIQIFEILP